MPKAISTILIYPSQYLCIFVGEANETACASCEPGYYCASPGLVWPTDQCDPGWYCTLGSELAQPSDPAQGGKCLAGWYTTVNYIQY